jgi:hypothetical protein
MEDSRLSHITFLLPNDSAESRAFFDMMASIFAQASGAKILTDRIILAPTHPPMVLPITSLQLYATGYPEIVFETDKLVDLHFGLLHLHSSIGASERIAALHKQAPPTQQCLPVGELHRRLEGHVARLDHTGVNIPVTTLDQPHWNGFLRQLAAISALYKYPDEEWYFVLPAAKEELKGDIQDFVSGREPKFELVYEPRPHPLLQFSLGTSLTRNEAEVLFPEPYGAALPELEDIFRSVHVAHPWPDLSIRFDLYYRGDKGSSDWETGKCLVTRGRRIR